MKLRSTIWTIPSFVCLGCVVSAQENRPAPAAVDGVKGVKQEAVQKIKNVETGTATSAKGVNKVDGINTINGVKAEGQAVKPPVQPVVPPPVQSVVPPPISGTAMKVETGTATGTATSAKGVNKVDGVDTINGVKAEGHAVISPIQHVPPPPIAAVHTVQGIAGINAAKLQNLEAALKLKHEGTGTPTDKGKAAAAALGGVGPGVKPGPKPDGRDAFQEFQKLQTNGS